MVGLLGPVVVSVDGVLVQPAGRRERVVLAVLACAVGRVVRDDRLVEALWADDPPRSATGTLQAVVSRLRSTVGQRQGGPRVIERVGDGYRLTLPGEQVDGECFEQELERARRGRDEGAYTLLEVALARWRGDALGDAASSVVLGPAAARLNELRLVAVEEQIELGLRLGRHVPLIPRLEQLVADHPLRERFTALLMTALYRAGRQTDALRAFTRTRKKLIDELGLQPSQELVDLQSSVLRHDDTLTAADVDVCPDDETNNPNLLDATRRAGAVWTLCAHRPGDQVRRHRRRRDRLAAVRQRPGPRAHTAARLEHRAGLGAARIQAVPRLHLAPHPRHTLSTSVASGCPTVSTSPRPSSSVPKETSVVSWTPRDCPKRPSSACPRAA